MENMKKRIECKIPETYWKTPAGTRIAQAMHSDGWDASDCLTSVMDLLEEGIKNTQDAAIVEELKKARKQRRDSLLNVVDGNEINVLGGLRREVQTDIEPFAGIDAGLRTGMTLHLAEKFEDPVKSQRLADTAVGTPPRDDGGPVDGERNAGPADEHFGLELALLVRIVETAVDRVVLHRRPEKLPRDISRPDVVERGDFEQLGKADDVFRSFVVDPEGFSCGILAEIHNMKMIKYPGNGLFPTKVP